MNLPDWLIKWSITGYLTEEVIKSNKENKMEIIYIIANIMFNKKVSKKDLAKIKDIVKRGNQ